MMKNLKRKINDIYLKCGVSLILIATTYGASANSIIPIPASETPSGDKSIADIILTFLQAKVIPIVEIGGAVFLLYTALSGLWKGYRDYQDKRDMGPLKEAVIASVILVVIGGVVLYLLDSLRTFKFTGG